MKPRGLRATALSVSVCLAIVATGCGGLDRGELHRKAGTVAAVASEGALLAHQVARDRSKDSFVSVHAEELASSADDTAAQLHETAEEGGVPPELRKPVQRTIALAADASDALDGLALNRRDPVRAADLERRLERTADQADRLVDNL